MLDPEDFIGPGKNAGPVGARLSEDTIYQLINSSIQSGKPLWLAWANLSGAKLGGANLSKASLYRANLSGADLRGTNLRHTNISWADLSSADLNSADLFGANLQHSNLRGAQIHDANLQYAQLEHADLEGADILPGKWLNARYNMFTRWPEDDSEYAFDPVAEGAKMEGLRATVRRQWDREEWSDD